jgi:putative glutathione S-transferase
VFGDPFGDEFANTIGRGGPFPPAYDNTNPDPELNAYSIRQIYENVGDNSLKYTIPLLWDKKLKTIVNNESSDIAYMLNSSFNQFALNPDLDLYTEDDEEGRAKLNEVTEWLSPLMIHGVYRCGFAKNQIAYDEAIAELCDAYDRADDILQAQRYLTGETLTDADIRLFVTLIRFDEVYAFYFKANARMVMLTPSLLNFCREIYQLPGIADTCDMEQIKAHFYGSHAEWNKYSVIPRGLGFMELLGMPHDREELTSDSLCSLGYEDDSQPSGNALDETGTGLDLGTLAMQDDELYVVGEERLFPSHSTASATSVRSSNRRKKECLIADDYRVYTKDTDTDSCRSNEF